MSDLAPQRLTTLRSVLAAYLECYGGGESLTALRAIAGSIVSVQARAGELTLRGLEIEAWVDALVQDFDPAQVIDTLQAAAAPAIAAQVKTWRETLAVKARATLDAYLQTYAPDLNSDRLRDLLTTILPIVEDTQIARDEAKELIEQISQQFDPDSALNRVLDTKWVTLANRVHQALQHRDLEAAVQDIVQAYVYKFKPALVEIGEGLIEEALQALTNSQAALDLDLAVDPDTERLVVRQVGFKLRLRQASAAPTKTAAAIALG